MHGWFLRSSEEGVRSLGTRVTDICKHHVGSRNGTQVFYKSNKYSKPSLQLQKLLFKAT
ncbi:hypothetical protein I79_003489 [Cricetulus griseus]|uniref:Uncharacterized protein n=1 Tax=Cricetulus griseus TaxID=10029 RepID=G3H041_CRIGR|nr:hypothetical protein I79_003489 [Cricetulus griseus]